MTTTVNRWNEKHYNEIALNWLAGGVLLLDFSGQGPGVYFIKISIGDDFTVKRVVIF